jgi:DNA-binding HxlR family transcriptional regulator
MGRVVEPVQPSPLAEAMARVGDRWSLPVVEALLEGPRRFGELAESLPGISPNILTDRLRSLERDALVVARPYSHRPPRSTYELTAEGRALAGAVRLLSEWGARHSGEEERARHAVCGTPLHVRWYCPTCEQTVDEDAAEGLHYA